MASDTASLAEYNGTALVVTAILFLVLTWMSVALRTYVRGFMTGSFQVDDVLMLVAQANFTLSCSFILVGVANGLGHHNEALPQGEEIQAIKWQALATATYITNMAFIKLSLGVFLLRLATQKRYKWILWISMGVVGIMSTALFFWDVFQCQPVVAQWDFTIPGYKCVSAQDVVNAAYALSVLNIVTDWLYALLPIPMIWNAKMTVQAKITVGVVLSLGIFASVATLIRVKFLSDLTDTNDILYAGTDAMVWTLVEPGVAIVASSLVTIRPLLRQWRLKGFESSARGSSSGRRVRYGRSSRRVSEIAGGNNRHHSNSNNYSRPNDREPMPARAGRGPADVKLRDLESGYYGSRVTGGKSASRETTLTSRTSYQDGAYPGARGRSWGGGSGTVAIAVREDKGADGGGGGDGDGDAPWPEPGASSTTNSSSESVFVIEGAAPRIRGHLQGGKPVWVRTETLNSPEESEGSQGLRLPDGRGDGKGGPWPFS